MVVWLGSDVFHYVSSQGAYATIGLRLLYVLLSHTNVPAIQLIAGSFSAGLVSLRLVDATVSGQKADAQEQTMPLGDATSSK